MKKVIAVVLIAVIGYLGFRHFAPIRRYVQVNIQQIFGQKSAPAPVEKSVVKAPKPKNVKKTVREQKPVEARSLPSEGTEPPKEVVSTAVNPSDMTSTSVTEVEPATESVPEPAKVPKTLLAALVKDGQLDYTQSYEITAREQELHRRYREMQKNFDAQIKEKQLSFSEIKQFRQDLDKQKQSLAGEYGLTVNQLGEFEKYMNR